jgi:hypothetical protein
MKHFILSLISVFFSSLLFCQTHYIEVHPNGRVSSLLMTTTEYNSWKSNYEYDNQSIREALFQDIYQKFEDDFDFIFLILKETTLPSNMPTGELKQVSNNIQGIGLNNFDECNAYGSNGKLQAVIHLGRFNYMRYGPSLHELMHNWGNFGITTHTLFQFGTNLTSYEFIPHWGFSGGSTKGQLGGFKQSTLVENGNNNYTVEAFGGFANGGNSVPYNEMELYLMGMIPASQVSNFDVFKNITSQIDNNNNTYSFDASDRETFTPTSIVNQLGQRVPNSTTSQKEFKALAVVLTDSPLTAQEWNQIDDDIYQFSKVGPDDQSTIYNFWEATNQLGTIDFGNLNASVIDTSQQSILVTNITVQGQNNVSTINLGQNLQMIAEVLPLNATNSQVTWTVDNGTGSATISNSGILSTISTGTVFVKATAQDGSNVYGLRTITIQQVVNLNEYHSSKLHIFPNPAKDYIHIEADIKDINIFNILGKELSNYTIEKYMNKTPLYFDDIKPGLYFLNYQNNKTLPFVIE